MRLVFALLAIALVVGWWARRAVARRGWPRAGAALQLALCAPFALLGGRLAVPYLPGPVAATAESVRPGVEYERHVVDTPRRRVAHVVRVDLSLPGLRLGATRPDAPGAELPYRARTTSAFVEETGAVAAINGDFFEPWSPGVVLGSPSPGEWVRPLGATWSQGRRIAGARTSQVSSGSAFAGGSAQIALGPGRHVAFDEAPHPGGDVVGGLCMLVVSGAPVDLAPCRAKKPWQVHPRSAIGLDRRRDQLLLVVVDGRQPRYSAGAELDELARLLVELGADDAMSLDGGGSSSLVVRRAQGSPRLLGSPIADRIPGRERAIANHIGVFVDR